MLSLKAGQQTSSGEVAQTAGASSCRRDPGRWHCLGLDVDALPCLGVEVGL